MGFREGAYAKVWKIENKGNYSVCNITTGKRDKETGIYRVDFQDGFVKFIGSAHKAISEISLGERESYTIKISSCEVTNVYYDQDSKKFYTNYNVYGFEEADSKFNKETKAAKQEPKKEAVAPADDEEEVELPFN